MATKQEWDELIAEARDHDEDLARRFEEKFGATRLREQAEKVPELERQVSELNAKVTQAERAPKRDKAFGEYGIDFEALRPAERRAIENYDGDLTPEAIGEFVAEIELPMAANRQDPQPGQGDKPKAAAVAAAARSAPQATGATSPTITQADLKGWTAEKIAKFERDHPEELEQLLRDPNAKVTGITGF